MNSLISGLLFCSKNLATSAGLAMVLRNLAYNPCIEEINLSQMNNVTTAADRKLVEALGKLFQLTVSLKKVRL